MSWYWYIVILIILIIVIFMFLANKCFDDKDPDLDWNDNYAAPRTTGYCKHPEMAHYTKILQEIVNCETTVTACALCGKHLTEPETDCR
tara:strand:+ start:2908 stop:3174 length:267 start_codon:yes stop_codon:yes gene_type:complete